jgi:hypothetical protein
MSLGPVNLSLSLMMHTHIEPHSNISIYFAIGCRLPTACLWRVALVMTRIFYYKLNNLNIDEFLKGLDWCEVGK